MAEFVLSAVCLVRGGQSVCTTWNWWRRGCKHVGVWPIVSYCSLRVCHAPMNATIAVRLRYSAMYPFIACWLIDGWWALPGAGIVDVSAGTVAVDK